MRIIRWLVVLFFLLAIAGAVTAYFALGTKYSAFGNEVFVNIPPRTPTAEMARILREAGVIRAEWQFLLARAISSRANLQAGEYRFGNPASVWDVYGRLARGDVFFYELRVPEGSNQFDIAASLEKLGLMKSEEFLKVAGNPSLVRDLDPKAPSLEGFLFPSTYRITRQTTAEQLCREMIAAFRKVWDESSKPGADLHRALTLASLVEKETAVAEERPTVASVYANRLTHNMTLDCDPTTIYAALLENRYRGTIYRSDLDNPHPYNTYRHPGLPPGPIANPGVASIRAAIEPAETDYLFFVAKPDGSGGHIFSKTLAEHSIAVAQYRRGLKSPAP